MKLRYEVAGMQSALRFLDNARSKTKGWPTIWLRAKPPNHAELIAQGVDVLARAVFQAEVLDEGRMFLPRRVRHSLAHNNHRGFVELYNDRKNVFLQSRTTQMIAPVAGEDETTSKWRRIEEYSELAHTLALSKSGLRAAIEQVLGSVATDETRGLLTGVSWSAEGDTVRLAATDSYRMALKYLRAEYPIDRSQEFVLSSTFMRVLSRALKNAQPDVIGFVVDEERVIAYLGESEAPAARTIETWPIKGQFPNYAALVPSDWSAAAEVPRDLLLGALKRARSFSDRLPVMVEFGDNLTVTAGLSEESLFRENIRATTDGGPASVAFNPRFLLEGVKASTGSRLRLEVVDDSTPAVVRSPEEEGFLYLLMPVRVSNEA